MQDSEVIQLATFTCFQVMTTLYLQQDQITCVYRAHAVFIIAAVFCDRFSVSFK